MIPNTSGGTAPLLSRGVQCSLGTHCDPQPRQANMGSPRRSAGVLDHWHRSRHERTRKGALSGSDRRPALNGRALNLDMSPPSIAGLRVGSLTADPGGMRRRT